MDEADWTVLCFNGLKMKKVLLEKNTLQQLQMCIRDRLDAEAGAFRETNLFHAVREKQELQKKQKTLDIIQQNFTALLDVYKRQSNNSENS